MNCQLCSLPVSKYASSNFCCHGCKTVYQLLEEQGKLETFRDEPIWKTAIQQGWVQGKEVIEEKGEGTKLLFEVEGLFCPFCAEIIRLSLLSHKGVEKCAVDYSTDIASVVFNPMVISKERIFQLVHKLGYLAKDFELGEKGPQNSPLLFRLIVAAFSGLNIMMFTYPLYFQEFYGFGEELRLLSLLFSLPVLFWSALPLWRKCFYGLRHRLIGMETLVFIGVFSSFTLSLFSLWQGKGEVYFDSMVMIITFVLLGKFIESKVKWSAKENLFLIERALPKRGRKRCFDGDRFVSLKEFNLGDLLVVLTGEKIVLDGEVIEGGGSVNEALMTGEGTPLNKKRWDKVIGGSILESGWLLIRVTATEKESTLYQILSSVVDPLERKSGESFSISYFLKAFVPLIILLSFCTLDFERGISLLLIACPCAIGIAIPMAESKWIFRLSELGVIVRNRAALSLMGKRIFWVFDKTGTLTEGKLKLSSKLPDEDLSSLKALANFSIHPVARSLQESIDTTPRAFEEMKEVIGQGIVGRRGDELFLLGSQKLLRGFDRHVPSHDETGVYFSTPKRSYLIEFSDPLKDEAKEAVKELNGALFSGDRKGVVERVARELGIERWKGEMSPEDKKEEVAQLQREGHTVAMVGDGINDAPALAQADLSISPFAGSDISKAASDLYLSKPSLLTLKTISQIGKRGNRIIKQNLFWAFFYNGIGIGLAFFGYLKPIFATFAMIASSLIVLLNSRRL